MCRGPGFQSHTETKEEGRGEGEGRGGEKLPSQSTGKELLLWYGNLSAHFSTHERISKLSCLKFYIKLKLQYLPFHLHTPNRSRYKGKVVLSPPTTVNLPRCQIPG